MTAHLTLTDGAGRTLDGYEVKSWCGRYSGKWLVIVKAPDGTRRADSADSQDEVRERALRLIAELRADPAGTSPSSAPT